VFDWIAVGDKRKSNFEFLFAIKVDPLATFVCIAVTTATQPHVLKARWLPVASTAVNDCREVCLARRIMTDGPFRCRSAVRLKS
jgi:hypothetical protein